MKVASKLAIGASLLVAIYVAGALALFEPEQSALVVRPEVVRLDVALNNRGKLGPLGDREEQEIVMEFDGDNASESVFGYYENAHRRLISESELPMIPRWYVLGDDYTNRFQHKSWAHRLYPWRVKENHQDRRNNHQDRH